MDDWSDIEGAKRGDDALLYDLGRRDAAPVRTRKPPTERRLAIMRAAAELTDRFGLYGWKVGQVATEAGCSRPLVIHYYGGTDGLRAALIRVALREPTYPHADTVLRQARLMRDPVLNESE